MRNTKPLRNTLLIIAVVCALTGVLNLAYTQVPNLTPPVNALAFILFLAVAILDHIAARKAKRTA